MCYSSIFPQKNWWIGPVCGELIWHLSNECWWGIQACSPRANPGVWVSAGLFPTLKESLTKKTDISQQELQMWTCWNVQVKKKEKNLLCCLHWCKPSSFVFCYSFIWTDRHALLPDSVISPRAWMKMCFWLSITFFMRRNSKQGPSPPCHLVRTCRAAARHDGQQRQASTLTEARTAHKIILMSSWRRS